MKEIYKALADFQQEVPVIHKATKGYGYSYSDLPTIFPVINPLLKKYGLGFTQLLHENQIETILFHCETGQELRALTNIPQDVQLAKMNQFQVLGSAVTYIRRYALSAMLGLVTDKDTDAGGEQKKAEKPTENKAKEFTDKDMKILQSKLLVVSTRAELKELYVSNAQYKLSKEAGKLFTERGIELES
jgi:hypothetical protein